MSQLSRLYGLALTRHSDYADQVWVWVNDEGSTFYFDVGEIVRFRVETEEWHDQIPNAPELADAPAMERKPPYSIIVRDSLGCLWTRLTDLLGLDADGRPWTRRLVVKAF